LKPVKSREKIRSTVYVRQHLHTLFLQLRSKSDSAISFRELWKRCYQPVRYSAISLKCLCNGTIKTFSFVNTLLFNLDTVLYEEKLSQARPALEKIIYIFIMLVQVMKSNSLSFCRTHAHARTQRSIFHHHSPPIASNSGARYVLSPRQSPFSISFLQLMLIYDSAVSPFPK